MDVKYLLIDNPYYEYHLLQQKLSKLAADGWELEKAGNFFWKFRRSYPQQVRYEIIFSPAASAFNSHPTQAEEELADLCALAGWERVASVAQLQIYRNPDPNATPLETDEVEKLNTIRRTMKKHFIPQQLLMIVLFVIQLLMHGSTALEHPTRTLSSMLMVTTLAMLLLVIATYGILLVNNLLWLRKASHCVENGGTIPPSIFYRWFRWVIWGMVIGYLILLFSVVEPYFTIWVLSLSIALIGTTVGTITLCKRFNAPRWANLAIPVVAGTLVVMAGTFLLASIMDEVPLYSEQPRAELLTLEQLTGEPDTSLLVLESGSSPLTSYTRYFSTGEQEQISCTLVDIYAPFVYDTILNEQEQRYIRSHYYVGNAVISDELRELIGADYLRRSTGPDADRFFICWEDRIVLLHATWTLTDEQAAVLADVWKP